MTDRAVAAPQRRPYRGRRPRRWVRTFYWKAYRDNVTGLSAMVAYNLLLSLFPLALLALFIAGRVLESGDLERSVLADLQRLFPSAAEGTLDRALDNLRGQSTGIGIVALVASIWIGSSFWGALDTAFDRIYHFDESRGWLRQKRFALVMLLVVLAFMAITVLVPTAQSLLVSGANDLPLGLSEVEGLIYAATLAASLFVLFLILCVIYWAVPYRRMPWRAVWPGAIGATLAMALVDWAFPAYLSSISTIARVGTTFLFVLIVLIWFYVLALIMLGGAVVNALRYELHETGTWPGQATTEEPGPAATTPEPEPAPEQPPRDAPAPPREAP